MNRRLWLLALPAFIFLFRASAWGQLVSDQAVENQSQRMVFQQWDPDRFYPKPGFFYTNPYYWLVWGLFDPNYPRIDRRPLAAAGPQTIRLGLVRSMGTASHGSKITADSLASSALSETVYHSAALSAADPLWLFYYRQQFRPLLEASPATLLGPLQPAVAAAVWSEGLYSWYSNELAILRERLYGALNADMSRAARIMTYYRLLAEYNRLSAIWNSRICTAGSMLAMQRARRRISSAASLYPAWQPGSDLGIASRILSGRRY